MKVITRREFIDTKRRFLFSEFEPNIIGPLSIKEDSWNFESGGNDYRSIDIASAIECDGSDEFHDILKKMVEEKISADVDLTIATRDGMFGYDKMYIIWENKDIDKLIGKLQELKLPGEK